jgi:hypothetical protein
MLKKYNNANPYFSMLPAEVKKILINKFSDLLSSDLTELAHLDNFELPEGENLFNEQNVESVENPDENIDIENFREISEDINQLETEKVTKNKDPIIASDSDESDDDELPDLRSGKRRVRFAE